MKPARTLLAPGLEIARMVTGLWQVADMERSGSLLDPVRGAQAMAAYLTAGFDTFDMDRGQFAHLLGPRRGEIVPLGLVCHQIVELWFWIVAEFRLRVLLNSRPLTRFDVLPTSLPE